LIAFVARNQVAWRVRPDNKVVVKGEWETPEQRLGAAERVLSELARLASYETAA
jgi:transcription-repair coupling factor (superfamily II helicase)